MSDPTPEHRTNQRSVDSQERLAREAVQDAVPPAVAPQAFEPIGRYEIRRVLGEGTFGCVYLAFDPELKREVAIKVPLGAGTTPALRDKSLREARATAGIHHANVCPVFDIGTSGTVPFIVMRYVAGGTLADLLARVREWTGGPLLPDEAVKIAHKLAMGLAAAHAKGIVHRDLKPGNILYDKDTNEVLITDFGLAKLLDHASQTSGGVKGTPVYMSPEQFGDGDRPGAVGPLSDVYSLGVIFYELLTGRPPFAGNPYGLMLAHIQTPPERPSVRVPVIDARLDELCLKALAKDPAERYRSAAAFGAELAVYARAENSLVLAPPPEPHTQAEAERRARSDPDYELGERYYVGHGVPRDFTKARAFWEKAAARGSAFAQNNLGWLYHRGLGVRRDFAQAREWYEKAAAQGDAAAQNNLGWMDHDGLGAPRDYLAAREWYEKAAAQGYAAAQHNLGLLHQNGEGVPQDYAQAREWYEKAAAQGHGDAQVNLGLLYHMSLGVPRDYAAARELYEKAAAQGNVFAQVNLASLYENGRGVTKDIVRARTFYRAAAAQGNQDAQDALKRLGERE